MLCGSVKPCEALPVVYAMATSMSGIAPCHEIPVDTWPKGLRHGYCRQRHGRTLRRPFGPCRSLLFGVNINQNGDFSCVSRPFS